MPTIDLLQLVTDARKLRPNTKRAYANAVRQWLEFAGTDPKGWTTTQAQAFYNDRVASGQMSVKAVNRVIVVGLRWALKRANALYETPNVAAAIDTDLVIQDRDAESNTRRAWTAQQGRAVIAACAGRRLVDLRDRAAVVIGSYTGMRRMSLVNVRLDQVHVFPGYVTLTVVLKGGARYDVPLDARAWALTAEYRVRLLKARVGFGPMFPRIDVRIASPDESFVRETALTEDGLYKTIMRRIHAADVPGTLHTMRHNFVTWCRVDRIEDRFVEAVTGHLTGGMVNTVYTDQQQLYPEAARRCYEAVATRLGDPL